MSLDIDNIEVAEPTPVVDNAPEHHARFKGIPWYDPNYSMILGGVGGIGSMLAFMLGRAGYTLILFDDDRVEKHNQGNQLFSSYDIGSFKTEAVRKMLTEYSNNYDSQIFNSKYTEASEYDDIMFSCFDNMAARKVFFENWCKNPNRKIFIDGRLAMEYWQIYTVVPGQEDRYRATLFDDSEVEDAPCTVKATSHCGAMIASVMMGIFTNYIFNVKLGDNLREIPFKTAFDIPTIQLDVEC